MIEYVIKRDGRKEAFDPEKLNSWGIWASKTIDPKVVNWSSVVLRTVSTLPKQVTTDELQKALIKSCIDMDTYEHNRMAGRLYADALPKQLYKDRKYPHIRDLHKEMSKKGLIRKDINYTDEEYDRINKMIKHKRDIGYTYYSSHHIMSKYAKKDHTTKKTYETPQFVYMRVAMQTFLNYQGEDRMEKLENLYTKLSTRKINIPTPYFANSLTSNPNVASCFLPGALVDTSTKRQAIATIEVGTEVLTHTGTYKKVIDKFSRKFTGKLVGLTTVASYPQDFECTYNHRIYAVKRTSAELAKQPDKSSPEWIEADHLRVGDYIKLGVDLKETPFNYTVWDIIKNNEEVSDYELIDNVIVKVGGCLNRDYPRVPNIELNHPDFFRLVGYYLAEGCITKPSVGSSHFDLTFGTKDEYFITDAKNICLNLFGLDLKEYPRTQDNSTKLTSYSKVLCALMLELCGTGFNTKFLTSPLMTAPRELQEELLVGIIRGDGCSTISGFKLSLANKELVYQLKNIALRLNLHISLNGGVPSERYRNRVPMCTLQINVDGASLFAEKVAKDIHKIRKNKSHPGLHILFRNDGVFARVRGIYSKEVNDIEVWDLTVEEDHSFVVNSLSVHNCSVLTTKDEAQSIGIGSLLAYSLTTSGAGLGLHLKTRSLGDAVRGGDIEHSGKVPYYRAYAHSIKSSKQGCYDTETEVLTEKGWKYFKDLTEKDLIVQVHDDLSVEAVKPTRIVEYRHTGKMYKFEGSVDILVTPDHRMVYKSSPDSKEFLEDTADRIDLSETGYLFNSANTTVESEGIPSLDDEDFTWVKPLTHSSSWLRTFLKELVFRNGSNVYTNEKEECIDIVQMAAALCGIYTHKKDKNTIAIYSSEPYTSKVSKEEVDYDDMVYCVEVPSNKIIVRRKGLTLICGNSRGGAGTMYFPFFDPEVITLLNLKNPLSVDSKRLRELDYALLVNKWFVRKAIKKEPVWLFSYKDNPELYELFYDKDPDAFGVAMEEFAQKHKKKVTEVNASEILAACLRQSVETGRVYMMFADEANRRSPYKEKIYSSNLCTEILLPTKPYGSIEDLSSSDVDKGTVAFCNLAGIVVDNIEDDTDYEDSCYYALLMIDEGINNALLPYESLNHSIRYYRSAGVGILGLAHLMAKNKLSYKSREGLTFIHNLAEKHAYYLYKSALRLGKERGNAECMDRTLFPEGWLPIDVMNPNLGDLCDTELKYDWETLRQEIVANGGIRFSTVSTIPPSENCLAFDTKVKTDKGDMTLKEIFDGYVDTSLDEAMKDYSPLTGGKWYELNQPLKALTASGEYHTIPRIWLNGIVKPFKITLEDGTVVKATESHKFLTDRGWVPAYDLKVGDNIINIAEE